ncbi:MAG: hypothetical protein ACYC1Z_12985, partial [Georgenia sp.]
EEPRPRVERHHPSAEETTVLDAAPGSDGPATSGAMRPGTPGVRRTIVGRLDGSGRPDADRPDADRPDADRPDADRPDAGRPDDAATSVGHESSLFSGSKEAEERAEAFSGPGAEAFVEREQTAERKRVDTAEHKRLEESRGRPDVHGKDAAPGDGADGGDGD